MGSPTLVRTLLREGLVDELRLMIEPVILGGGKSIFPDDGALRPLELVSTVTSHDRRAGLHLPARRPRARTPGGPPAVLRAGLRWLRDGQGRRRHGRDVSSAGGGSVPPTSSRNGG